MKKKSGKKPSLKTLRILAGTAAQPAFPPALPRIANLIVIAVIFIWAFLLYGNTLLNKFSVDDTLVTGNDIVRQGSKAIPAIFSSYLIDDDKSAGSQTGSYRPLARATFAIEYSLWKEKPGRSHLVNVFLYFIASLITFYVLRRLLVKFNILFPILITILFMAHPVHTEVVASLKNRDEILAYLFGMGGMYTLLTFTYTRKFRFILLSCIWFIMACVSQMSALPFMGLYILVLYFFSSLKQRSIIIAGCMILLSAFAAFLIPRIFISQTVSTHYYFDNALFFEKNLWIRLGTTMISLLFYLRILLYPHPLLYYYGYNMIPLTSLSNGLALLSVLIHTVLLGYAIINIRRKTFLSFAILWYLTGIFIYSNLLVPVVGVVAERFVFLASLGFIMTMVFLIFKVFRTEPNSLTIELESRIKIIGLVIAILIPYGLLTISRNTKWRDTMSLFTGDMPRLEKSAKANYQYASYLLTTLYNDKNFISYGLSNEYLRENIKKHLRRSLKVYPNSCNALNDLGAVFLNIEKQYDSALYYFQKSVAMDPTFTPGWANMGMVYHQLGQYIKAMACYQKVIGIQPGNIMAYLAIADLYSELGDINKARYYYALGQKAAGKKENRSF
ncbi:MAG: tetratricopeptide repeat protein [Bacteroidetes bacterium]|nr:tetratricopeptide repeat protein [Bacteroidota bacterium]